MDVKTGTQAWSTAAQTSGLRADNAQNLSPADMEKALGGRNLGEVLNKVADPNWVDPAKTRRVGNADLDKDAFFKLMLTQMKHQDPTNPMQSHEMAAQLAQFTSLEQLNNINATLADMKTSQQPSVNYQALNFIGKKVAGDSSKLIRAAGDKSHDFSFDLAADAADVKVVVKDLDGNVVQELSAKNLKKGANSIVWNGLTEDGQPARAGDYRLSVDARGGSGNKVFARTEFDGKITGMNFTPQGPVLMVGTQTVRLQDVKKIYEPSPEDQMLERAPVTPLEATGVAPKGAAKNIPGAPDAGPETNILNKGVTMDSNFVRAVAKEQSTTGKEG